MGVDALPAEISTYPLAAQTRRFFTGTRFGHVIDGDLSQSPSNMQSASGYFSVASPSSSVYSWFFDVYTNASGADQIQIYESWTTPTGGWGKQIYSNVTVGASTWSQVWQANDGSNILMFFRSSQRTSGYEDILAIVNWCKSKGLLTNSNFYSMSFGIEITSTSGWESFYLNGYSASWTNTSGGGSGI